MPRELFVQWAEIRQGFPPKIILLQTANSRISWLASNFSKVARALR